jgi:hypothetical protein
MSRGNSEVLANERLIDDEDEVGDQEGIPPGYLHIMPRLKVD